jgi:hypothetical protein
MIINVTIADLANGQDQGSVWVLTGTAEDGARVTFAGDHRPMRGLADAVMEQGEVSAEVEPWQVLGSERP